MRGHKGSPWHLHWGVLLTLASSKGCTWGVATSGWQAQQEEGGLAAARGLHAVGRLTWARGVPRGAASRHPQVGSWGRRTGVGGLAWPRPSVSCALTSCPSRASVRHAAVASPERPSLHHAPVQEVMEPAADLWRLAASKAGGLSPLCCKGPVPWATIPLPTHDVCIVILYNCHWDNLWDMHHLMHGGPPWVPCLWGIVGRRGV